jgi:hypothetical protein
MPGVRQFFIDNEKVLSGLAAIATVIALAFAGWQLRQANKSLEASTVHALQRDGHEMLKTLREKPEVYRFIFASAPGEKPDPKIAADVHLAITELVQYFSSVMNQRRNGVISDAYWPSFDREMCLTLHRPAVRAFWEEKVVAGAYSDDFKQWGGECLQRNTSP